MCYKLNIFGKVQGVYFRASTLSKATELNVAGMIKNKEDGSVQTIVQGKESAIAQFIEWCLEGPASAKVSHINISKIKSADYKDFTIHR